MLFRIRTCLIDSFFRKYYAVHTSYSYYWNKGKWDQSDPLHSVGQIEADLYTSIKGFNSVHDREKTS